MKFLSFVHNGKASWGTVVGNGVVDLTSAEFPTLKSAIEADALQRLGQGAQQSKPVASLDAIDYLPVIPDPGKIVCVGLNYDDHVKETKRDKTENPTMFLRVAESQTGHNKPILLPPESHELDYEGEIAIIIGKGGRRIAEADAWDHIAGYAPYNDGSIRDWQRHTIQFTAGKNFNETGGFGPWMVTRDEIADGESLSLETRLNGQVMQKSSTDMMIFDIPRQINYISTFTTLKAGDVIVTGTPGGVGAKRNPPVWMKEGDIVEIEVGKVGTLVNTIKAEKA